MSKRIIFNLFLLCSILSSCVVDGQKLIDYDNAVPLTFSIEVLNNTDCKKDIVFERTNTENDKFLVQANSLKIFDAVVCIDKRWRWDFFIGDAWGRMIGESEIGLIIDDNTISIGKYKLDNKEIKPTYYGEFITGELKGAKSGVYNLKLTINADGALLEYL